MNIEAGVEFSIGEEVGAAVHGAMNKHRSERPRPLYDRRSDARISDGTHIVTLDVGAPPSGRIWVVTGVTVFGADDHTVVAGVVAAVYTGNANQLSLSAMVIPSLVIPSYTHVSDDVLWVHSNENLCVQMSAAGSANQQFGVNFHILSWNEHEVSHRTGH